MSVPAPQSLVERLQRRYRSLRRVCLLGGAAGAGYAALLVLGAATQTLGLDQPNAILWPTILIVAFGAYNAARAVRIRWVLTQLRLERAFLRHAEAIAERSGCLKRHDHLWSRSGILRAWQLLVARPLPRFIDPDDRAELTRRRFHQTLRIIRPHRLAIVPLLALPGVAIGLTGATLGIAAALALLPLAALAVLQSVQIWSLRAPFRTLLTALTDWTAATPLSAKPPAAKPYQHTRWYRAAPWFTRRSTPPLGA